MTHIPPLIPDITEISSDISIIANINFNPRRSLTERVRRRDVYDCRKCPYLTANSQKLSSHIMLHHLKHPIRNSPKNLSRRTIFSFFHRLRFYTKGSFVFNRKKNLWEYSHTFTKNLNRKIYRYNGTIYTKPYRDDPLHMYLVYEFLMKKKRFATSRPPADSHISADSEYSPTPVESENISWDNLLTTEEIYLTSDNNYREIVYLD